MIRGYREEFRIERIKQECPDTKTFFLKRTPGFKIMPGQFLMVNIPDQGERPFSPSFVRPKFGITVRRAMDPDTRKQGKVTSCMIDSLKKGDRVEILGPHGNSFLKFFDASKPTYLVAGGCGGAPLRHFAQYLREKYRDTKVKAFLGSASPDQVLFEREFSRIIGNENVFVGIDEPERPGKVVELLNNELMEGVQVYICGPRPLLKAAARVASEYLHPQDIIISTEPIMKCGRGVCGSCEIGGYHACQDGPNFTYKVLKDTEFFQYRRTKSGRRIPL